jgi:predicted phosphohydrolase
MILCAAGDAHGALAALYRDVYDFAQHLRVTFTAVLHVGDFGIWPNPDKVDKATRKHDGAGDFPAWIKNKTKAPVKTVFIKGNHEDFDWLDVQPTSEISPNLFYLKNGTTIDLDTRHETIRIGGVGGCYGPSDYEKKTLFGQQRSHYTKAEIENLRHRKNVDILLTHDAPNGVELQPNRLSNAAGLDDLVASVKPQVCFFGHHHRRITTIVNRVQCYGLNKVGMLNNLIAIDIDSRRRDWTILGEWPF